MAVEHHLRAIRLVLGVAAADTELRQQGRECLRLGFQRGEADGFGFAQLRVVAQGLLVDLAEVRRVRQRRSEQQGAAGGEAASEGEQGGEPTTLHGLSLDRYGVVLKHNTYLSMIERLGGYRPRP